MLRWKWILPWGDIYIISFNFILLFFVLSLCGFLFSLNCKRNIYQSSLRMKVQTHKKRYLLKILFASHMLHSTFIVVFQQTDAVAIALNSFPPHLNVRSKYSRRFPLLYCSYALLFYFPIKIYCTNLHCTKHDVMYTYHSNHFMPFNSHMSFV